MLYRSYFCDNPFKRYSQKTVKFYHNSKYIGKWGIFGFDPVTFEWNNILGPNFIHN